MCNNHDPFIRQEQITVYNRGHVNLERETLTNNTDVHLRIPENIQSIEFANLGGKYRISCVDPDGNSMISPNGPNEIPSFMMPKFEEVMEKYGFKKETKQPELR